MTDLSIVVSDVDEVRTYTVSNIETGQTVYELKSIVFDDEGEKALMLRMVATICKGRLMEVTPCHCHVTACEIAAADDAIDDVHFHAMNGAPIELLSRKDRDDFWYLF